VSDTIKFLESLMSSVSWLYIRTFHSDDYMSQVKDEFAKDSYNIIN